MHPITEDVLAWAREHGWRVEPGGGIANDFRLFRDTVQVLYWVEPKRQKWVTFCLHLVPRATIEADLLPRLHPQRLGTRHGKPCTPIAVRSGEVGQFLTWCAKEIGDP